METVYQKQGHDWILVGFLSLEASGQGSFEYAKEYVEAKLPTLDRDQLRRLSSRKVVIPSQSRHGLPGVIQDSGPDSWGRAVLKHETGRELSHLEVLSMAMGDGSGNIVVGDPLKKPKVQSYTLEDLNYMVKLRMDGIDYGTKKNAIAQALSPETSLGGAKPKVSLEINGQQWIAKFPERGDPVTLACFEDFAMKLGGLIGIDVALSGCQELADGTWVYTTKRFDRVSGKEGVMRLSFASAMTVMGQYQAGQHYSYIDFVRKMKKWTSQDGDEYYKLCESIWLRVLFNAMIGNLDDHARNHGILKADGEWGLSPAYDILPTRTPLELGKYALSMSICDIDGKSQSVVSVKNLIHSAVQMGIDAERAKAMIEEKTQAALACWDFSAKGCPLSVVKVLEHAKRLTEAICEEALNFEYIEHERNKRKPWRWAP